MERLKSVVVTGGAGFIGSSFVRHALAHDTRVVIYDALTYAGHLPNVEECLQPGRCELVQGDIRDQELLTRVMAESGAEALVNFAAETHVDNSISGPRAFVDTNITGTFHVLEAVRARRQAGAIGLRLVHVSTDEVFGELGEIGQFSEGTPYAPSSPYSASKAAADHLVRAWNRTYGLPTVITHCSNNYGPRQFPEKLIPRLFACARQGKALPIYGRGMNVRDWIHVEDHAAGVWLALTRGRPGESYCFGGSSERQNIAVARALCSWLDRKHPRADGLSYLEQIAFVEDRPGHDFRYAIDSAKAESELGFTRTYKDFEAGLAQTLDWYLENTTWWDSLAAKGHV